MKYRDKQSITAFILLLLLIGGTMAFGAEENLSEKTVNTPSVGAYNPKIVSVGVWCQYLFWNPAGNFVTQGNDDPSSEVRAKLNTFTGLFDIAFTLSPRWSLSGSFEYSQVKPKQYTSLLTYFGYLSYPVSGYIVSTVDYSLARYYADIKVRYRINQHAFLYFGLSFLGLDLKENRNRYYIPSYYNVIPYIPSKEAQLMAYGGFFLGFRFPIHVYKGLFIVPDISILGMAGKVRIATAGARAGLSLVYSILSTGLSIEAGFVAQYSFSTWVKFTNYGGPVGGIYGKRHDIRYGPSLGIVYAY